VSGAPEDIVISVAELDRRLRRAVESASGEYWVEGEVSSLKRATSGHLYFTLKDEAEDAVIDCVLYRFDALRAQRVLKDGAKILLSGRATVWAPRGRLQFVGQRVRLAGRGALLVALEALKQKLHALGYFDPVRKRALPPDPKIIGVVTSRAGAAFHDIRTVAFRRGKVRLVLSPALVQGEGAPESLVRAIDRLERYPGLEVIIIGRGGGSGEDLMAFNDEQVVRRIAVARVPVVSAVGHETDLSLADLVADVRAATPSQAAELVVPDCAERSSALDACQGALGRAMRRYQQDVRGDLERLRAKLSDPRFVIAERQQELDELEVRLRRRMERAQGRRRQLLSSAGSRLVARHPRAVIAESRAAAGPLAARLSAALRFALAAKKGQLSEHAHGLHALSPLAVLGRGYAIALAADGTALLRSRDARVGDRVLLRLSEGELGAEVREVRGESRESGE